MKDLQSDKKAFCSYTVKWATTIELLLENHLSELLAFRKYVGTPDFEKIWHETAFCKDCAVSHTKELLGYASEAITGGGCGDKKIWEDLFTIADELHNFLVPLNQMDDYTLEVFEKVEDFESQLRSVRKELEAIQCYQDDGKEHLT